MGEYLGQFSGWLRDHEDSWWGVYAFILRPIVNAVRGDE